MLSRVEKVLALKNVELFHDISGEVLADIASFLEEIAYDKGSYIVNEGELGKELYIIIEGEVEVVSSGVRIDKMTSGASFGEMSIIDSQPRSADVVAIEDVLLLKIERDDFYEILKQREEVALGVIRVLNRRIRNLNLRLLEKGNKK